MTDDETLARLADEANRAADNLARAFGIDNEIDIKAYYPDRSVLVIASAGGKHFAARYGYPAEIAKALACVIGEDVKLGKAVANL